MHSKHIRVRNLKFTTYLKFATCENTNKINLPHDADDTAGSVMRFESILCVSKRMMWEMIVDMSRNLGNGISSHTLKSGWV